LWNLLLPETVNKNRKAFKLVQLYLAIKVEISLPLIVYIHWWENNLTSLLTSLLISSLPMFLSHIHMYMIIPFHYHGSSNFYLYRLKLLSLSLVVYLLKSIFFLPLILKFPLSTVCFAMFNNIHVFLFQKYHQLTTLLSS
jgi:hypothetical protein